MIAIVLAVIEMKKKQGEKHGKATAGLVLSIIAVVISVIMLIACGGTKNAINEGVNAVSDFAQEVATASEEEAESLAQDAVNSIVEQVQEAATVAGDEAESVAQQVVDEVASAVGETATTEAAK